MPHFLFLYPSEHNGDGWQMQMEACWYGDQTGAWSGGNMPSHTFIDPLLVWRPEMCLKWWQHAIAHLYRSPSGMEAKQKLDVVAACHRTLAINLCLPCYFTGLISFTIFLCVLVKGNIPTQRRQKKLFFSSVFTNTNIISLGRLTILRDHRSTSV